MDVGPARTPHDTGVISKTPDLPREGKEDFDFSSASVVGDEIGVPQ